MTRVVDEQEIYALNYSRRTGTKSNHFHRFEVYDEPDDPQDVYYYFWLAKSAGRNVLVDCGFDPDRVRIKGRRANVDPVSLLAHLEVAPDEVDHVVISHMHYDHVGNLSLFPNASFSISGLEFEYWTGPMARRSVNCSLVDSEDIRTVQSLHQSGRLRLVENREELFPGITMRVVGGHTPGQAVVEVGTASDRVVLASDAAHFYEELCLDRPFDLFHDLDLLYCGYDYLRALDQEEGVRVVPGHDPLVVSRFTQVAPGCVDLRQPIVDEVRE